MEETQVYAASCPDYEQAEACIRALVEQMGGMGRFVRPGERIVLKANLLRAARRRAPSAPTRRWWRRCPSW